MGERPDGEHYKGEEVQAAQQNGYFMTAPKKLLPTNSSSSMSLTPALHLVGCPCLEALSRDGSGDIVMKIARIALVNCASHEETRTDSLRKRSSRMMLRLSIK